MESVFHGRADYQGSYATAGPAAVERAQVAFVPNKKQKAVCLKIRVRQQLRDIGLEPLIGLGQSSIVRIVTCIRDNVREVRQGAVGDVLRKIRRQRNQVQALVRIHHIAEIGKRVVALEVRPGSGITDESNRRQALQIG